MPARPIRRLDFDGSRSVRVCLAARRAMEPFHDVDERVALHHRTAALDALRPVGAKPCRLHDSEPAHEVIVIGGDSTRVIHLVDLVIPIRCLGVDRIERKILGGDGAARLAMIGLGLESLITNRRSFELESAVRLAHAGAIGVRSENHRSRILAFHGGTRHLDISFDQVALAIEIGVVIGFDIDHEPVQFARRVRVALGLDI